MFAGITAKTVEADAQIHVTHGEPLLFGKARDKGLRLHQSGFGLEVVTADTAGILQHDETNPHLATLLAALEPPMPVAIGVILDRPGPTYDAEVQALEAAETAAPAPPISMRCCGRAAWAATGLKSRPALGSDAAHDDRTACRAPRWAGRLHPIRSAANE